MNNIDDEYLEQSLAIPDQNQHPTNDWKTTGPPSGTGTLAEGSEHTQDTGRITRAQLRRLGHDSQSPTRPPIPPTGPRRSTRVSLSGAGPSSDRQVESSLSTIGKKKVHIDEGEKSIASTDPHNPPSTGDRKGKKRAARSPSPSIEDPASSKRQPAPKRRKGSTGTSGAERYSLRHKTENLYLTESSTAKGKGKAKVDPIGKKATKKMPKKVNPRQKKGGPTSPIEKSKKGDSAAKQLIDSSMDADDAPWLDEPEASRAGPVDDDEHNDDDMEGSERSDMDDDHSDDEMPGETENGGAGGEFGGLARLAGGAGGMNIDEATAAAIFGGDFRSFGNMMSGISNRFKRLKTELRSRNPATRLSALRECSELLLVSNEDTLGGSFSTNAFATEFIAILSGKPNIDDKADDTQPGTSRPPDEMDEDAQVAAALAMSTGGTLPAGLENDDEMESQLVACRCLAHLMEALPGSGHTLVALGAVPTLCSKLTEISYIELAEQTLSTMEKISSEYPAAIAREGGLGALLNYLPFFSTNVQRTAVTAAANCCRNISSEHFTRIRDVFPILRETLTQGDQRLVEQATLAVVRTIESYRHNAEHLEGLLDVPTVVAVNALLMPSGGSPLLTPPTYTHLLRALTSSARGSAKVAIAFLEAGMTSTIYQILTGVLPSSHEGDEEGAAGDGQGLAGGVADMAVLQNLAHRPKDQVEEALALICELLPPSPRDGVFDAKSYTEKSLAKIKKGRKAEKTEKGTRRSSRFELTSTPAVSAGPSTPVASGSALVGEATPTAGPSTTIRDAALKAKRDIETQMEQRLELFKAQQGLAGRFIRAVVPVLVDVYAASVALRVRTKVLTALVKAVSFAQSEDMYKTLKSVPMASFICAIISSKDNATFVLIALQLVEILTEKLPDVYQVSFQREGVVFEIEALAQQDLLAAKNVKQEEPTVVVKTEPEDPSTPIPTAGAATVSTSTAAAPPFALTAPVNLSDELKPLLEVSGLPNPLTSFLAEGGSGPSTPRRSAALIDPNDANILRARVLLAKKTFEAGGQHKNAATAVLDELRGYVSRLIRSEASEGELRDTLRDVARQFSNVGEVLSSFELLQSGLVEGLLDFADVQGTVSSADRRAMLFDILGDTSVSTPSPLTMLVKRLHESLGRLEDFEVETAFNGVADTSKFSSNSVSRIMRVRLQAEDGQDIPRQVSGLTISLQAIAPIQALHDYLRPKVADGSLMSGSSGLSSMFAAYAAAGMPMPRGGSAAASRILSALNASRSGGGEGPAGLGGLSIASSAPESSHQPPPPDPQSGSSDASKPHEPTRRRSARLSAQGAQDVPPVTDPPPSSALSSSAPEPSILPAMPMDMDFDDDDYSDEDYDAEVFEEDMEEEMQRPTEKVVNMSVAPDGSRVEAKTPEGTRIATPNQAAAASNAAGPSGSNTPRTGSYAGAVKTVPVDWHLQLTYNGHELSLQDTIYGAVHRYREAGQSIPVSGSLVTFKFKKVDGPAPTENPMDAPSPASTVSAMPAALDEITPTSKILRLLRVVHNLSVEGMEMTGRADSRLDENLFVNNKLTAKLTRQLEEIMIIASKCLPEWAVELPRHFSFLFPFETRYAFLQSTSFGYGRLLARSHNASYSRSSHRRDDIASLARIVRQKVRISRTQLLESCAKVLELYGTSTATLEVEYFDEIGTGLGPTLEFYSIASREFAKRSLGIWRDEDPTKPGTYVVHSRGLYPAPSKGDEPGSGVSGSRLSWFKALGTFAARSLLDSRIIDVNLNKVFLKLVLGQSVGKNIATLKSVDMPLARSLERLQSYLHTRKEIEALQLLPGARRNKLAMLNVGGSKLADLSLDFTLPGYDIELMPGGALIDVDDSNLEEYLEKVLDMTLGSGVVQQAKAFAEGFSMIFPIQDMKIFSPEELGLLFGNADEDWSRETLEHAIKADHGYNLDSRTVQNLIETLAGYSKDERRQFLQFTTGAPKLPIGGFRGLSPQFTVVRKPHEAPFRADDYLPSVMTCAQYLKLPDYSTKEILGAQIKRAMLDGGGSFHLS